MPKHPEPPKPMSNILIVTKEPINLSYGAPRNTEFLLEKITARATDPEGNYYVFQSSDGTIYTISSGNILAVIETPISESVLWDTQGPLT